MNRRDYMMERLWRSFSKRMLDYLPIKEGRLLDVGCGTGILVNEASKCGFDAMGVDLDRYKIEYARKFLTKRVYYKNIFSVKRKFDIIVCSHVIEHFEDPYKLLKKLHVLLKPNGVLLLVTPNMDGWSRKLLELFELGSKWYGYDFKTHKILYTPNTLGFILKQTDFRYVKWKTNSMHYGGNWRYVFPMVWLFKMFAWFGVGDEIMIVVKKDFKMSLLMGL